MPQNSPVRWNGLNTFVCGAAESLYGPRFLGSPSWTYWPLAYVNGVCAGRSALRTFRSSGGLMPGLYTGSTVRWQKSHATASRSRELR